MKEVIELKEKTCPTVPTTISLVVAIANKILNELEVVNEVNKAVGWTYDPRGMSPGNLMKIFILSTFTDVRTPLTHIEERISGFDLLFLIGYEALEHGINAFNMGRALERLGGKESDCEGMYEKIALHALQKYNIPTERIHGDTTTISFYGEYDLENMNIPADELEAALEIEKGYNKDGRAGDNQAVVGQVVTDQGIPISNRVMNGATSDIEWNRIALDYCETLRNQGFSHGIFVADCKLMIEEHVRRMNDPESRVEFVSRCPANFSDSLEKRMIEKAYKDDNWQEIGQIAEGKKNCSYRVTSIIEMVFGIPMRLLVLESSTLAEEAERSLAKKEIQVQPLIKTIEKREFACKKDAEKELEIFKQRKELQMFDYMPEIKRIEIEKWPRGRRNEKTLPVKEEKYIIHINELQFNEELRRSYLQNESSLVLMSNVTDETTTDKNLLEIYKGQQIVENSFRQLKAPNLASVIYLKNPLRIKGLVTILCLSLLIRAIIQYRMRAGLKEFNESNPDAVICAGWAGRPLKNPTFQLLYENSVNCFYERVSSTEYNFVWSSPKIQDRVEPLLRLMGESVSTLLQG